MKSIKICYILLNNESLHTKKKLVLIQKNFDYHFFCFNSVTFIMYLYGTSILLNQHLKQLHCIELTAESRPISCVEVTNTGASEIVSN